MKQKVIPQITSLRFFAAIMVVFFHCFQRWLEPYLGQAKASLDGRLVKEAEARGQSMTLDDLMRFALNA